MLLVTRSHVLTSDVVSGSLDGPDVTVYVISFGVRIFWLGGVRFQALGTYQVRGPLAQLPLPLLLPAIAGDRILSPCPFLRSCTHTRSAHRNYATKQVPLARIEFVALGEGCSMANGKAEPCVKDHFNQGFFAFRVRVDKEVNAAPLTDEKFLPIPEKATV